MRAKDEHGAGSVLVLGVVGAVLTVTAALVPVLAVLVHSQSAANAADAAALAAADAVTGAVPGDPCGLARTVARRNGAHVVACEIVDAEASITVELHVLGLEVSARARAGPPREPP